MRKKYFSLKEARVLLPKVRIITHAYYQKIFSLEKEFEKYRLLEIESKILSLIKLWELEILKLGIDVKGIWLVDFDSGDGYYYCWCYNEKDIQYFHLYETGFSGRRPVTLLEN